MLHRKFCKPLQSSFFTWLLNALSRYPPIAVIGTEYSQNGIWKGAECLEERRIHDGIWCCGYTASSDQSSLSGENSTDEDTLLFKTQWFFKIWHALTVRRVVDSRGTPNCNRRDHFHVFRTIKSVPLSQTIFIKDEWSTRINERSPNSPNRKDPTFPYRRLYIHQIWNRML